MKKIIIFLLTLMMVLPLALGMTVTRDMASTVSPSSTFPVTYTATSSEDKWFAGLTDSVTGGCTPASYEAILYRNTGDAATQTKVVTYTAPASGSCTFSGTYQSTPGNGNIGGTSIITTGTSCTPINGGWSDYSTCSASCTQTRTCTNPAPSCGGTTCSGDSSQSCTGGSCVSGCVYSDWTTCSASCTQTRTVTSGTGCTATSQSCSGGSCVTAPPTCTCGSWSSCVGTTKLRTCSPSGCTPSDGLGTAQTCTSGTSGTTACQPYETLKTDGTCGIAGWVWVVVGFITLMIIFSILNKK